MLPCLSFLCFAVFGPPGVALGGPPSKPPGPPVASVQAFGLNHPACRAWTDGCVTCEAAPGGGPARCSTPGIACTPKAVACGEP